MNSNYFWAYLSMKKGDIDNDYYFYENGEILHSYDKTMNKRNFEEIVSPDSIPESDKIKIMEQCKSTCSKEIVEKVNNILYK